MDNFDLRKYVSNKTLLEDQPKKAPMKNKRRIHEAKSSIHKKLAEIENLGRSAALEIKMEALVKEIESRNGRLSMIDENEDLAELMNPQKIREMKKEIKMFEKQQVKYQKLLEKEKGKDLPKKEVVDEDDVTYEEDDVSEAGNIDSNAEPKSFLKKTPYSSMEEDEEDDVYENLKTHSLKERFFKSRRHLNEKEVKTGAEFDKVKSFLEKKGLKVEKISSHGNDLGKKYGGIMQPEKEENKTAYIWDGGGMSSEGVEVFYTYFNWDEDLKKEIESKFPVKGVSGKNSQYYELAIENK